jgi:hypothetical protein
MEHRLRQSPQTRERTGNELALGIVQDRHRPVCLLGAARAAAIRTPASTNVRFISPATLRAAPQIAGNL